MSDFKPYTTAELAEAYCDALAAEGRLRAEASAAIRPLLAKAAEASRAAQQLHELITSQDKERHRHIRGNAHFLWENTAGEWRPWAEAARERLENEHD